VLLPTAGRAVDRVGLHRGLLPRAVALGVATIGGLLRALVSAPVAAIALFALLMGAATPPVTAATRAGWRERIPSASLLGFALNLDASAHEFVFVCGPAFVALLAAVDPALALGVAAAAGV
jgi:hypothetical protein